MRKLIFVCLVSIPFILIQCKSEGTQKKVDTPKMEYKNQEPLSSVPKELVQNLFENSDYTDYIFHHLPFSMSQDEPASIRMNLGYISPQANAYIPVNCTPMARQFYHIKGEIVVEVDVYFDDNCAFYVFVENEKPKYSNLMSDSGKAFFKGTIDQALKTRK